MKWDDDIDFAADVSYTDALKKMHDDEEFLKDLKVAEAGFGYQYQAVKWFGAADVKEYVVDIFLIEKTPQEKRPKKMPSNQHYHFVGMAESWPTCGMRTREQYHVERCLFWGEDMPCPVGWKVMLEDCYGENVMDVAYKYNHRESSNTKVDLTQLAHIGERMPPFTEYVFKSMAQKQKE
jgi:hypothetical protein